MSFCAPIFIYLWTSLTIFCLMKDEKPEIQKDTLLAMALLWPLIPVIYLAIFIQEK